MTLSTPALGALLALLATKAGAAALPAYNADPSSVSVSGLSSGGFMAAQLGIAYSGTFQTGFGVFAGGPFDCARNQQVSPLKHSHVCSDIQLTRPQYSMCMNNNSPSTTQPNSNLAAWSGNQIDNLSNLKSRKIFLEVGTSDVTVGPNPMNALNAQLQPYVTTANTVYTQRSGQAHTFPTDFDSSGNNACGTAASPYISNCGYDGAGAVLHSMYGNLNPRSSTAQGTFVTYDQTGQYGALGMASSGTLYVPKACQGGTTTCKLHVALHGCQQTMSAIGAAYTTNTGYNLWAGKQPLILQVLDMGHTNSALTDTNNILILYPQGTPDNTPRQAWQGLTPNPYGCWDWIGKSINH